MSKRKSKAKIATEPVKVEEAATEVKEKATAKKQEAEKAPEVSKVEVAETSMAITEVSEACDAVAEGFKTKTKVGFCDLTTEFCQDCQKNYPASFEACKHNTEVEMKLELQKGQVATKAKKAPKVEKAKKEAKSKGEKTPLGGLTTSGAGKIELLLLSKEGATMEEMKAFRGAVTSHLASLKGRGIKIEKKGNHYFASLPSKK